MVYRRGLGHSPDVYREQGQCIADEAVADLKFQRVRQTAGADTVQTSGNRELIN